MEKYFKHKMRGKSPIMIVGIVLFGIVAIGALAILFGYILMSLWNWLMPELFDLPMITYWQAVGLFFLAKILFGFGGGSGSSSKKSKYKDGKSCRGNRRKNRDFSKWSHYDKFWEDKGEEAYNQYVENLEKGETVEIIEESKNPDNAAS
jgi:hypothetical protein